MKASWVLAAVGAVAIAAGIALHERPAPGSRISPVQHAGAPTPREQGVNRSTEAVLGISPGMARAARPGRWVRAPDPLRVEFERARNYAALYQRLEAAGASRSAEESYLLYRILQQCGRRPPQVKADPVEVTIRRRRALEGSLDPADPMRAARLAAFDVVNHDRCEGLEGLHVDARQLRAALESAAHAGSAAAQAEIVVDALSERFQARDASKPLKAADLPSIGDEQLETLERAAASGDPDALVRSVGAMQMALANLSLHTSEGQDVRSDVMDYATRLVACDLGSSCGSDMPEIAFYCEWRGQCGAGDYRDFLLFYKLSPADSQLLQDYYQRISRVAASGDWSGFTLVRGPAVATTVFVLR